MSNKYMTKNSKKESNPIESGKMIKKIEIFKKLGSLASNIKFHISDINNNATSVQFKGTKFESNERPIV
jgi:hypothetical protein